jgi:glutamine synthetase
LPSPRPPDAAPDAASDAVGDAPRTVQLEFPDLDGGLRAKLVSANKAFSPSGAAMCTILFGLTVADDVYESPVSGAANGYPDLVAMPDMTTMRALPWARSTSAVICDLYDADGARFPIAPRSVLRRVIEGFDAIGYEARVAAEWEFCVLHRDDEVMAEGRHGELRALGRTRNAYSSLRLPELRPLSEDFMARMDAVGIDIESMHTELGDGMFEIAISHTPALEAVDAAVRAKTYFKEMCGERDLVATFMSRWRPGAPTAGCHFHQSLWRDSVNSFAGPDGLSDIGQHYLAGQLATMRELAVIFNPTINAYRRLQPGNFTPATASWGLDNRTAAIRLILGSTKAVRLEHRRCGADVNPYLAVAAMLAGGLYGIEQKLELVPAAVGDAFADPGQATLPTSLAEAIEAFEASTLARELLGAEFVDHYSLSRRVELDLWERWQADQVTEWEHHRYLERS